MTRIFFIIICILIFIFSCRENNINLNKETQNVINTDIEFSNFSEKEGMKKSFLKFADEKAVILKNHSMPIVGKKNIGKSYTGLVDTVFTLTWKPLYGYSSKSADLAYTYGTYTLSNKNDTSLTKGTYVSIWKKQADGTWKWVLDSGNEGLE